MKRKPVLANTWCIGLFILCLLPVASCNAQTASSMKTNVPQEKTAYTVPKEKAQLWEDLKTKAQKDYDICQEHCSYQQACLDRCETAYKNRLENDYKMLTE